MGLQRVGHNLVTEQRLVLSSNPTHKVALESHFPFSMSLGTPTAKYEPIFPDSKTTVFVEPHTPLPTLPAPTYPHPGFISSGFPPSAPPPVPPGPLLPWICPQDLQTQPYSFSDP